MYESESDEYAAGKDEKEPFDSIEQFRDAIKEEGFFIVSDDARSMVIDGNVANSWPALVDLVTAGGEDVTGGEGEIDAVIAGTSVRLRADSPSGAIFVHFDEDDE
jgi:hypothetical protein